jgi:hypothetical protein
MKLGRWLLIGAVLTLAVPLFAQGPPDPRQMEAERAAAFDEADADGNGTLSLEEFKTFESLIRQKMAQHFKDANGDGAAPPPLPAMDPERHFKQLDTNGDGAVSLDELQAERPRFGRGQPPPF